LTVTAPSPRMSCVTSAPSIYHMTHVNNLLGIIAQGGLWCDRKAGTQGHCRQSIAHSHIKERRAARQVPVGPGGTLADYVPFYFATRQPMLYAINGHRVSGYVGDQGDIVFLRYTTERLGHGDCRYVFSNGHAEMALAEFAEDLDLISAFVDFPLMEQKYWNDTPAEPNRKFRRQAEFLIHDFMPWSLTEEIGVYSDPPYGRVVNACARQSHRPPINLRPEWYF
jgi:hypothetical protein